MLGKKGAFNEGTRGKKKIQRFGGNAVCRERLKFVNACDKCETETFLDTIFFHNAVEYDNFAHLHRTEFGRVRDEKENLSRPAGFSNQKSNIPAVPITGSRFFVSCDQVSHFFFAARVISRREKKGTPDRMLGKPPLPNAINPSASTQGHFVLSPVSLTSRESLKDPHLRSHGTLGDCEQSGPLMAIYLGNITSLYYENSSLIDI